jgi:hypothetical protein
MAEFDEGTGLPGLLLMRSSFSYLTHDDGDNVSTFLELFGVELIRNHNSINGRDSRGLHVFWQSRVCSQQWGSIIRQMDL